MHSGEPVTGWGAVIPTAAPARSVAAALSSEPNSQRAAELACEEVSAALETSAPDAATTFAVALFSREHLANSAKIVAVLRRRLGPGVLVGCGAESVIGGGIEQDGAPGIAVMAARLPGVVATPFCSADLPLAFNAGSTEGGIESVAKPDDSDIARLALATGMGASYRGTLLFADPFSASLSSLLPAMAQANRREFGADLNRAQRPILGGIASASSRPGANALIMGDRILHAGVVGLTLRGPVRMDPVVSQGCRAFGQPLIVTAARGSVLKKLGAKPALQALNEAIEHLDESQRDLLRKGVFVGRVVDEYKDRFGRGDFLIRGVMGVSKDSGEIAINDVLRVGQTVQFHLRDAVSATEDLELALDAQRLHAPPLATLLFTCNGRGRRMFPNPNHDAAAFSSLFRQRAPAESLAKAGAPLGPTSPTPPMVGMFAAGEIGPVGGLPFVHGFTASAAVIRSEAE